jgi:ABC-type multidrug transport system ATPase subunit
MPGKFSLYQDLSVEENLEFFASLFQSSIRENYDLISDIYKQLEPFKNRRAGKLSGGMKQKLALCCALIHRPKVLFLDEPTTGVDPVSRKEFWDMLRRLQKQDIAILVSTPYMDEATQCDRIAFMQDGTILTKGTPDQIVASYDMALFAVRTEDMFRTIHELRAVPVVKSCYGFGSFLHVCGAKNELSENDIRDLLAVKGYGELVVERITPGIEDCFMRYMIHENEIV